METETIGTMEMTRTETMKTATAKMLMSTQAEKQMTAKTVETETMVITKMIIP